MVPRHDEDLFYYGTKGYDAETPRLPVQINRDECQPRRLCEEHRNTGTVP